MTKALSYIAVLLALLALWLNSERLRIWNDYRELKQDVGIRLENRGYKKILPKNCPGERYVHHFRLSEGIAYVQLTNDGQHSVLPNVTLLFLDGEGEVCGWASEIWSFNKLHPGESKNKECYIQRASYKRPAYYKILFK